MFGATNIVKYNDKEKYVYSDYGTAFDGRGSWSLNNDSARNVIIFGLNNSSSSHTDNQKNDFLVLGEGPTFGINGSFGLPEKKFSINFSKTKTTFCLSLHYNGDNSCLFVDGREIFKFKASKKYFNFPSEFCLGNISNKFDYVDSEEVSLKRNVYDFSVDQLLIINQPNILNIYKYLMNKNNI